jgi:gliding motility-associated-like protein
MDLHAFKINFLNAHTEKINAKEPTSDYVNYYLDNDKEKWASNVKKYGKTAYKNIYDSVDLKFYLKEGFLKYDFVVAQGGNPSEIQLEYEGIDGLVLEKGALKISTSVNEIIEQKPYAYQLVNGIKKKVKCNFKLEGSIVSFEFPRGYNKNKKLIIDPTLVFASYSGSTVDNWGYTSTFDDAGHLYGGGATFGIGYPTTTGAFQLNFAGGNGTHLAGTDITISKFSPDGTSLIYATYLGGNGNESPHSLIVNDNQELLIMGTTSSNNYPVTASAYDTSFDGGITYTTFHPHYNGGSDIVITKIDSAGQNLLGSTYMGGSGNDGLNTSTLLRKNYADEFRGEIIIDDSNNVYVASTTFSTDFPTTTGVFQANLSGGQEGCVFKLSPDLSTLIWSTFLGGSNNDAAYSLQFDDLNNILITGGTESNDFPIAGSAHQPTYQGGATDGWIAKINSTGTFLLNSTYIGTSDYDQCYFVQLDTANNVYVIGQTEGTYPITPSTVHNNPNSGQFIHKLTPSLSNTVFSTTFGTSSGEIDISLSAFLVNDCNYILISGWGGNTNVNNLGAPFSTTLGLPVTSNAIQPTTDGSDYYLTMFNEDADSLLFATFFGGTASEDHVDGGTSRFDKKGIVYQAVCASCGIQTSDFPTTTGAYSSTDNSAANRCNMGVFKLDLSLLTADADVYTTPYYCVGDTVHFQNLSNGGVTYTWNFGDGTPNSNAIEPYHAFTTSGTYNVRLIALDAISCIFQDTDYVEVFIGAAPIATALPANGICPGDSIMINVSGGDSSIWITNYNILNDTLPTATVWPDTSMIYSGVTFNRCGSDTTEVLVTVFPNNTSITADTTICNNMSLQIVASGGNNYLWSPAATLNNPNIANPTATPGVTTTYNVTITDFNTCVWDTFMTITTISLPPIADAGRDTQVCLGDSVQLNATGGSTYNWDFSSSMSNPNISDPFVFPTQNTAYSLEVMNACGINRDTVLVTVSIVNARAWPDTIVCSQQEIQLFSSGGTAVNWEPQNEVTQTQNGDFVSPSEPTTYTVTIENSIGCQADTFVTIGVNPLPFLEAGPDQWVDYENIFLEATGVGVFSWSPSPFLSCDTCQKTQVFIDQTTVFTASLTDSAGCISTDELTIYVPGEIYAPNAFTPNGDGKNDMFFLKTYQIDQFDLQIFNRWGQLLFQTEDKTEGWDGYYKGVLSKNDVYIWKVKYTDIVGERDSEMGTVTLVR